MLKMIGVSLIGVTHRNRGDKLQDFFGIHLNDTSTVINNSEDQTTITRGLRGNDPAFIFVADGAGSARHGGDGARYAVNSAIDFVRGNPSINEQPEELLRDILRAALDGIKRGTNELNVGIDELATTFIALYVRGRECFSVSVGDGYVIIDDGNELRLLNEPVKGEYFNETLFITSPEVVRAIESGSVDVKRGGCNAFVVVTDGLWPTIIGGKPYERFYRPIIDYLRGNDVGKAVNEVLNLLRSVQERYSSVYDDDLTMVVGTYE